MKDDLDLTSVPILKELMRVAGSSPNKELGQNFITSKKDLGKIVKVINPARQDFCIEIGPGLGALTSELLKDAGLVLAIEKDRELSSLLTQTFRGSENLKMITQDVLKQDFKEIISEQKKSYPQQKYIKIVGNLPYYLTSTLLKKLLTADLGSVTMVFLVQKEVAERVIAEPGQMGILSLAVQLYGEASIEGIIKSSSFWPQPKVDAAVLKIVVERDKDEKEFDEKKLFRIAKAGFSQKRKKLRNSLAGGLQIKTEEVIEKLKKAEIDPEARPQELSVDDWIRLSELVNIT